jgi:trehalose 6-phosphate phosphatase
MSFDRLPPFGRTALMLDMDGTLVDLAPVPDAVVVAAGLVDTLRMLRTRLDGALAIVTGRPIETVDALLRDGPLAVAGEHGGAIRHHPSEPVQRPPLPVPPESWLAAADALAARYPGALVERKARGFALHYRAVPEARVPFQSALAALVACRDEFQLLQAHMLWEVRPRGVDKGSAVTALMERAPFAGRVPMFIGDDVTDEDGMAVARTMGGAGLRVDAAFGTPSDVRTWLRQAAETGAWPRLPGESK